jgi:hypothetical protein
MHTCIRNRHTQKTQPPHAGKEKRGKKACVYKNYQFQIRHHKQLTKQRTVGLVLDGTQAKTQVHYESYDYIPLLSKNT